jgi:4-amino-4-deoxy-L-arabinose transferase-like glycosyltransferase
MSRSGILVLAAAAAFQIATVGWPDIYDELPGQYAGTAREVVDSGDWLVPSLAGIPRLQKPPLVYWMTAVSLRLFGRSEFAARLPSALALVGLVLVTRALGTRLHGPARGEAAAAILATSLGIVALGKLIMPEPFLALGIALSLYAAVRAVEGGPGRARWGLAAWGAAALATVSKGLHGLLLPAAMLALVAARRPASRPGLAGLVRPWGPALFLAIVLPWPLYIESRFPGYLLDNLVNEQLGHVLDRHFPRDSEPTPLALLWAQHAIWWFPWVLFGVAAALNRAARPAHPLGALPAVWLLTVILAASLTGQRQDYHTMSGWPAFALLLGRAWEPGPDRPGVRLALLFPFAVLGGLGISALAAYAWPAAARGSVGPTLPFVARNSVAGALTGIAGPEWRALRSLLVPAAAGLLLATGAGFALACRSATRPRSWIPVAIGALPMLLAAVAGLQAVAPLFGLKDLAAGLAGPAARAGVVAYDGPSHTASSLAFYTDVPVRWLERPETEFAVRSRGIGRDRFIAEEDLVRGWREGEPVWLITEESRLPFWQARLGEEPGPLLARSGTRVLVGNPGARLPRPLPASR